MIRRPEPPRARRGASAVVIGVVLAIALVGCTAPALVPSASPSGTNSASASASLTPEPTPTPTLDPEGSAGDNLPLFAAVTGVVWASGDRASGRAYIDALVAAGFDKSAMQLTSDTTTVGNPAESIQFAVQWGDECLIGQVGPATGEPVAIVGPALASGGCLVGDTRPIDW